MMFLQFILSFTSNKEKFQKIFRKNLIKWNKKLCLKQTNQKKVNKFSHEKEISKIEFLKNIEKSVLLLEKEMSHETTCNLLIASTLLSEDIDKLNQIFSSLKKEKTNKTNKLNEIELRINEVNSKWKYIDFLIAERQLKNLQKNTDNALNKLINKIK